MNARRTSARRDVTLIDRNFHLSDAALSGDGVAIAGEIAALARRLSRTKLRRCC